MSTPVQLDPPAVPANQGKLHLKLVTRKFWPYAGSCEQQVADTASALSSAGHEVEILTARWHKTWPTFFRMKQTDVYRLVRPNSGPWGSYRYSRALSRHASLGSPDGVIVFGAGHELTTIHRAVNKRIPFVAVVNELDLGIHPDASCLNHRQTKALLAAEAIICESDWTRHRLEQIYNVDKNRISIANNGVSVNDQEPATIIDRNVVRRALADAHPMLAIPEGAPMVACVSPLVGDPGLVRLVHAWRYVVNKQPNAKLWLIGEGPRSLEVWEAIVDAQLTECVIMPGEFDWLEDIATASDVLIHNLGHPVFCSQFLRTFLCGSASIVSEPMADMLDLQDDHDSIVVGQLEPHDLADVILATLADEDLRENLAQQACRLGPRFQLADKLHHFIGPIVAASRA